MTTWDPIAEADPDPIWILRQHSPAAVTALAFVQSTGPDDSAGPGLSNQRRASSSSSSSSSDEELGDDGSAAGADLISGDANGAVSLTSLQDRRPWLQWQAHAKGKSILGVDGWMERSDKGPQLIRIITHGRDNEVRLWQIDLQGDVLAARGRERRRPTSLEPRLLVTLPVNALNFCRFSYVLHKAETGGAITGLLLAVPHSLDSGYIDVVAVGGWDQDDSELQFKRLHTAVGKEHFTQLAGTATVGGVNRAPTLMSMHLLERPGCLTVVAGYEDGYIRAWISETSVEDDGERSEPGPWRLLWQKRAHRESIFSSAVLHHSPETMLVASVGADDRITLISFPSLAPATEPSSVAAHRTPRQGRSSVAFVEAQSSGGAGRTGGGASIVVGGWDGRARIYRIGTSESQDDTDGADTETLQCTSVLRYHKDSIQALASTCGGSDGKQAVIAVGGKEGRISLWGGPRRRP
ncbi:unnamed protein product [Parajaminaea phylloscopi]